MTIRFEQQVQSATPVDNPILLASEDALVVQDWFYQTETLDVRAFNSYALQMQFENGTWVISDLVSLYVTFYADPAGTIEIFTEKYQFYINSFVRLTDQMHGPYMRIESDDPNLTGNDVEMTFRLYGSYRQMASGYLRVGTGDLELYDRSAALAAGANDGGNPARLGFGPMMLSLISTQANGTVDVRTDGTAATDIRYQLTAPVANTRVDKMIVMPRDAGWLVLTNNGAAAATVRAFLVQQIQPQ